MDKCPESVKKQLSTVTKLHIALIVISAINLISVMLVFALWGAK